MEIQEIVDYVMRTPGNTNPAVLKNLIETYAKENSPVGPIPPSGEDIVYDGGEEQ